MGLNEDETGYIFNQTNKQQQKCNYEIMDLYSLGEIFTTMIFRVQIHQLLSTTNKIIVCKIKNEARIYSTF